MTPLTVFWALAEKGNSAFRLSKFLRVGILTIVHPPTVAQEAVRSIVRAREDFEDFDDELQDRLSASMAFNGDVPEGVPESHWWWFA